MKWLMFLLMIMIGKNGKKVNVSNLSESKVTIILLDSSGRVEELREIIQQKNTIIITFDYESHKILSENKTAHELSDNYLNEGDLQTIQKDSYKLARWCEEPEIVNSIIYEGINLGGLFYPEFHYFLVPFLKKFVEVANIVKKFNEVKFVSSAGLYEITKSFTDSVSNLDNKRPSQEFLYDSVRINLKISNKYLSFNIPQTYYLKLKKLSEKIEHLLSRPKSGYDNNAVLFVEFDTIRYEKIFSMLPKFSLNTIFYSRRRPTIWNLKSFSIIKKSGCKVATYYAIVDKEVKKTIENNTKIIVNNIDSLWEKEEFYKSFFSIKGFSFWNAMKLTFIQICKKRLPEGVEEIELAKKLFEKYRFKSILVWSESGFNEQIIIKLAKKLNIPIVLLQHGLYFDTPESYELNKFAGILPIDSDKFAVWGEVSKQYAITCNLPSDKIEVLGSPLHDDFFVDNDISNLNNSFVLLATSGPAHNFVNDLAIRTNENYEENIKKICKTVSKMNKKLVIKLHPSHVETDITKVAKEINPEIIIVKSGNILPLIKYCEVVVVIDISTVIGESQILKKPVISVSTKDYGFDDSSVFKLNPYIKTNIDNFEILLNRILTDVDFKKQLVSDGSKYVNNYFSNQGIASEKLLSFLEKL